MKRSEELSKLRKEHVPKGVFNTHPIFVQRAQGALIQDVDGKEYIDFAGGIGVQNVGHCATKIVDAIRNQAEKYIHTCFHVAMYEPYLELAKRLNEVTPGDFPKMTMFANSGAEAVENGIKIARYYTKRQGIIAFENGFHGRTLLAMSLTSKVKPYKWGFGPFAPEVYRMPFAYCYRCSYGRTYPDCGIRCAEALRDFFINQVSADQVAAIIAEPVQGEGGFITPPKEYFKKLKEMCEENGIVFIMDEIQSGMGRTGYLFASEYFEVEPDIILSAKSLAAGMPLSAITGRAEIMDAPHVGGLGGTYGGNPVSCAAALAVLDTIEQENLLKRGQELGKKVRGAFEELQSKYEIIGDVRGLGPMLALELVKDRKTKEPAADEAKRLVQIAFEKGLVILSCGNFSNVIRILMPLSIEEPQLEKGLAILEEGLEKVC
ncbi:MAG: 4-aminobutyrate--2-oxoglutarate transaminase [Deltaproteobacteria bacterium]|nr:4-aminobutyrate--2-oxoglutarate transaminase [Deltaproteobacteria bacterium]MBW2081981.1 4-aminobutyrate--2-oxoglutarate transaminase [Deltaproteobacteria bacterium]HDM09076.1 4-aminobutyrate--2-oxoglutarate transaminase [Desulfobacteraceae bacterium]